MTNDKEIIQEALFSLEQLTGVKSEIIHCNGKEVAFLKEGELFLFITGQKAQKKSKTNQSRAFHEAGIRLIFSLLKDPADLLNRWIIAYNDIRRPRLLKKRMRFSEKLNAKNWKGLLPKTGNEVNLWGGEPGAAIFTSQLKPG